MNIIIVDDEITKAGQIAQLLDGARVIHHISHVTTATAARRAMKERRYDLAIIDLYLPDGLIDLPEQVGGFNLLDLLMLDDGAHLPDEILFLTAKEDDIESVKAQARSRGATLWEHAKTQEWQSFLVGRIRMLERRKEKYSGEAADVVLLTALHDPELTEVLKLPYNWKAVQQTGEPLSLYKGICKSPGRELSVVAACTNRKGMPAAAACAARLIEKFRPSYIGMLGICAGVPNKTQLGDVVVADPTWDYGSGKRAVDASGSSVFLAAPFQSALDPALRSLAEALIHDPQFVRTIKAGWQGDTPIGTLSARMGPMASGASVISDSSQTTSVVLQQREALAIEMEAYGVMAAAEYACSPRPRAFVVKSVCDFADSAKSDDWQRYAAYTSAQFGHGLLTHPSLELRS